MSGKLHGMLPSQIFCIASKNDDLQTAMRIGGLMQHDAMRCAARQQKEKDQEKRKLGSNTRSHAEMQCDAAGHHVCGCVDAPIGLLVALLMGDAHPDDSGTGTACKPPPLGRSKTCLTTPRHSDQRPRISFVQVRGGRQASQARLVFLLPTMLRCLSVLGENAVSLAHVAVCLSQARLQGAPHT